MPLGEAEKREILRLARKTLETYLSSRKFTPIESTFPMLKEKRGVFVTLQKVGAHRDAPLQLRGCIGHLAQDKPLGQVVQEMAIQAATGDPRFPSVAAEELPEIEIEISVLSPFKKIKDSSEIRVGEHGLLIVKELRRGLLLPQVAEREGWDAEVFLKNTCLKAGLPADAWQSHEVEIYTFTAEVFGETSFGNAPQPPS